MSPEQKTMAIWSSALAAAVLTGWLVLDWRGESLDTSASQARKLITRYEQSHPAKGKSAAEARKLIKSAQAQQEAALSEAEAQLVPGLPDKFITDDLNTAEGVFREVVNSIEQKAQRQNVKIAELPFKTGLDANPATRRMQLAQAYLFQGVIDACIEGGATEIASIKPAPPASATADAGLNYALLTCDLELITNWKGASQILTDLSHRQVRKGYGLRHLEIEQRDDGTQRVRLIAGLITKVQPGWTFKSSDGPSRPVPTRDVPRPPRRTSTEDSGT